MGDFFGIGSLAGAGVQAAGAVQAQKQSVADTRHGRAWQEMMASTAYQRTVKDLQAAGLNPALAFGGGSASPAPTPQTQLPRRENIGAGMSDAMSRVVSSATQGKRLASELAILKSQEQRALGEARTATNLGQASTFQIGTAYSEMLKRSAEAELVGREASLTSAREALIKSQTSGQSYDNALKAADADFYSTDFGQKLRAFERTVDSVSGLGRFQIGPRPQTRTVPVPQKPAFKPRRQQ